MLPNISSDLLIVKYISTAFLLIASSNVPEAFNFNTTVL